MSTDDSDLNDTVDSDEELSDTGKYKIDTAINSDEDEDDEAEEDEEDEISYEDISFDNASLS